MTPPMPSVTRRIPAPRRTSPSERPAFVVVLAGERMGEVLPLTGHRTSIGRGVTADIRINDEGISRTHAAVVLENSSYYLLDNGSTNGTFANGDQIDRYALREGDRIQLGASSVLLFTYDDGREEQQKRPRPESALRDAVTGLFSEEHFRYRLEGEIALARRNGKPLSLVALAIDQFARLQTDIGPERCDDVLRVLAKLVRGITRSDDILARRGTDGFCLVCRNADALAASRAAHRIRNAVAEHEFPGEETIAVSLGISELAMLHDPGADGLIETAATALYVATRQGRSCVEIYDPENEPTRHV